MVLLVYSTRIQVIMHSCRIEFTDANSSDHICVAFPQYCI